MNPSVDPKVTEDMDRRSLRSIHVISWIVLFLELAAFIIFLFTRSGNYDHEAFVSMASVCFSISMCALASFLSERMLRKEHLPHSAFFIFKIAAFIVFSVTAAFFDIRNYKAGEEIMTFFIVNLVMVCFVLFTSPAPLRLGLAATPLPAGTLYLAALAGISLRSKRTLVDGPILLKGIISSYISPLLAFLLAFSLGRIMDGELTGTFIVLGIIILIAGVIVYMRVQSQRIINQQIARAHEQQVYSTRKSLSALEVRAEMTEKDLLNKLDIKRKELVDFAVGISDQKEYMENVLEQLKQVRCTKDGAEKDARTDALLRSLRERMYFTREMNDFYTRSEELHKDFNERLAESFPKLTENERKLANLLRQGFSSKYIASLMNITPKSVEINRYRLRAKLGLARSENLINFIKSI